MNLKQIHNLVQISNIPLPVKYILVNLLLNHFLNNRLLLTPLHKLSTLKANIILLLLRVILHPIPHIHKLPYQIDPPEPLNCVIPFLSFHLHLLFIRLFLIILFPKQQIIINHHINHNMYLSPLIPPSIFLTAASFLNLYSLILLIWVSSLDSISLNMSTLDLADRSMLSDFAFLYVFDTLSRRISSRSAMSKSSSSFLNCYMGGIRLIICDGYLIILFLERIFKFYKIVLLFLKFFPHNLLL